MFFEKEDILSCTSSLDFVGKIFYTDVQRPSGGEPEFGLTCTGGFHSLHETCGTLPYFLC